MNIGIESEEGKRGFILLVDENQEGEIYEDQVGKYVDFSPKYLRGLGEISLHLSRAHGDKDRGYDSDKEVLCLTREGNRIATYAQAFESGLFQLHLNMNVPTAFRFPIAVEALISGGGEITGELRNSNAVLDELIERFSNGRKLNIPDDPETNLFTPHAWKYMSEQGNQTEVDSIWLENSPGIASSLKFRFEAVQKPGGED